MIDYNRLRSPSNDDKENRLLDNLSQKQSVDLVASHYDRSINDSQFMKTFDGSNIQNQNTDKNMIKRIQNDLQATRHFIAKMQKNIN